jgi:hypothetical protein
VVWSSLVPIMPFMLFALLFDPARRALALAGRAVTGWLSVAYLGWIATILAYAMWTGLLKRHPANRVAPFSLGVPVVGWRRHAGAGRGGHALAMGRRGAGGGGAGGVMLGPLGPEAKATGARPAADRAS